MKAFARIFSALALTAGLFTFNASAAEPLLEKVDIFEAGKDGYALYRIPGMVVTKKGTVLAYCEARRTGKSDWDTIDIVMRRSTDGGKTWDAMRKIADVPGPKTKNPVALAQKLGNTNDVTYNNATAIVDKDGSVHFVFCLEYCWAFYMNSKDEGVTWSAPIEITSAFDKFRPEYDWKVLAAGPAHGIQLKNGRLVVPVWLSTGEGGHAHRPSAVSVVYSDDKGKTWHRGDMVVAHPELKNPSETIVVELADGRTMLNIRSESKEHRRAVSFSKDGATKWSKVQFEEALLEPVCMASIIRVSDEKTGGKNRLAFANPDNLTRKDGKEKPEMSRDRINLAVKLSYDEGKTWAVNKRLEEGFSGYSDLAMAKDGTILCFYERGSTDEKSSTKTGRLTVARFNLEWLSDGKDTFKGKK
ncbi:MAG TPA: sialidase family protein [Verrucomicrobiae bacterium]